MAPNTVNIVNVRDVEDADPNSGTRRSRKRVQWKYGTHGPFVEYFDADTYDPAAARQVIEAKARAMDPLLK